MLLGIIGGFVVLLILVLSMRDMETDHAVNGKEAVEPEVLFTTLEQMIRD